MGYYIYGLLYGVLLDGNEFGKEVLSEMEEEIMGVLKEHGIEFRFKWIFNGCGDDSCYIGKIVFDTEMLGVTGTRFNEMNDYICPQDITDAEKLAIENRVETVLAFLPQRLRDQFGEVGYYSFFGTS